MVFLLLNLTVNDIEAGDAGCIIGRIGLTWTMHPTHDWGLIHLASLFVPKATLTYGLNFRKQLHLAILLTLRKNLWALGTEMPVAGKRCLVCRVYMERLKSKRLEHWSVPALIYGTESLKQGPSLVFPAAEIHRWRGFTAVSHLFDWKPASESLPH